MNAIFAFITRNLLAAFEKCAPAYFHTLNLVRILLPLIYTLVASLILGMWTDTSYSLIATILFGGAYLWINIVYFRKRKHLFVN